jgi:hypothetical protein
MVYSAIAERRASGGLSRGCIGTADDFPRAGSSGPFWEEERLASARAKHIASGKRFALYRCCSKPLTRLSAAPKWCYGGTRCGRVRRHWMHGHDGAWPSSHQRRIRPRRSVALQSPVPNTATTERGPPVTSAEYGHDGAWPSRSIENIRKITGKHARKTRRSCVARDYCCCCP